MRLATHEMIKAMVVTLTISTEVVSKDPIRRGAICRLMLFMGLLSLSSLFSSLC